MTVQATFIAISAILSISFASVVIEQFLIREALETESRHFWHNYQLDPGFAEPNTANLKGYLGDADSLEGIPEELHGTPLGFVKMHGQFAHSLLHTTEVDGKRLYLLFDGKSVTRLALIFGIVPLTIVLILIYIVAWWVYRQSNHVLSPIVWLANKFDRFDPAHPSSSISDLGNIPGDRDWEVETLVRSLSNYSKRIKHLVERERAFTRDASHEFRTPLTVIKMASDLLLSEPEVDEVAKKYGQRIKGSVSDMEELIDAFMILARETDDEFDDEHVVVKDVIEHEVKVAQVYNQQKCLPIEVVEEFQLELNTARQVLAIVLGNIIRNAVLYTKEGKIKITISEQGVDVSDSGMGMSEEQLRRIYQPYYRASNETPAERRGYGVGLTIVKRLCSRFDWDIRVDSELGKGTKFSLRFPL